MSKEKGYYKMQRGWMDNEFFSREPFTEREAWLWMIEEASWEPCEITTRQETIKLDRGQFTASVRFMARRFQWSPGRVQRFLKRLVLCSMSDLKTGTGSDTGSDTATDTGQCVVTIRNYSKYQDGLKKSIQQQTQVPIQTWSSDGHKLEVTKKVDKNKKEVAAAPPKPRLRMEDYPLEHPNGAALILKVVRISNKQWDQWEKKYSIDSKSLFKLLEERDRWLCQQPEHIQATWFHSTEALLKRRHLEDDWAEEEFG